MIASLHAGHLPAIYRPTDATLSAGTRTLTEVVTAAIYGAPLKPGAGVGSLREACESLQLQGWALWKCPNGPGWLRQHLEVIADGKSWPFNFETMDDSEQITMGWIAAAQRWLTKTRKLGFAHSLPPELAEKVMRLAAMSDAEATVHALAEADRIERAERIVNAKAADFYELLSGAIANERITLKAIATNPQTNIWLPRTRGEPPHQSIPTDYFELRMVRNLFDNELEADRFSTEAKSLDSIFERIERENEERLVNWTDVRVSPKDVSWLLSTFRDDGNATDHRPMLVISERENAAAWNPNWLSLPGAIMWVVTRDRTLTRAADEQSNNDSGTELGICVRLAHEKVQSGASHRLLVEIADAWPLLRRLIADEKIVAEGRSLERRGINASIEMNYPNQRIPSGDAANLIILGNVPGIEPRDALAPNEMYRFTNGQGRYWYDVRLQAADVFREFAEGRAVVTVAIGKEPQTRAAKAGRGRHKGSGSYEHVDKPLLDEMEELLASGKAVSPEAASHLVAGKAKGAGSLDSKAERLAKRYRASRKAERNFDRIKSDSFPIISED